MAPYDPLKSIRQIGTSLDSPMRIARMARAVLQRHATGLARDLIHVARGTPLGRSFYDAASTGRRMRKMNRGSEDPNVETRADGAKLRYAARYTERNSPHGRQILTNFATYLVGKGVNPEVNTGTDKLDKKWTELFQEWVYQSDPVSGGTLFGQQFQAAMALARDGGVISRQELLPKAYARQHGMRVPLFVKLMEVDHLDDTKDRALKSGGAIVGGVEFDQYDRRVAYHLFREHPGSGLIGARSGMFQSDRVSARDVAHLYNYTTGRPGQIREVSMLHAVIARLWDYDGWVDATAIARRVSALPAGFVHNADPQATADEVDGIAPAVDKDGVKVLDPNGYPIEQIEPGLIGYLPAGKEIEFNTPPAVPDHDVYSKVTLHEISAGVSQPYADVSGDLSEASFIASRMGRLLVKRFAGSMFHLVFAPLHLRPTDMWFSDAAVLAGALPNRPEGYPVTWVQTVWEEPNELIRIKAAVAKIRAGLTTYSRAVREEGLDPDLLIEEMAKDNAKLDAAKITLDSDPRKVTPSGGTSTKITSDDTP